jgi:hypothetical protein
MIRALELGSVTAIVIFGVACKIVGSKDSAAVLVPVDITASTGIQKQVDEINALTGYRSDSNPDVHSNANPSAESGNVHQDEPGLAYSAVESVVVYKIPENKHSRNFVKTIDSLVDGKQGSVVSPTLAAVCARLAEMPLPDSVSVDSAAVVKSESCGKRLSRFKVDAKELESDYRFLSEMVQEPYLTDTDLRIVAAHESIRSYLESNLEVVEGKTEQYRLSWVERGVQRSALLVFGIASQKIAILQYRTLNN